MSMSAAATLGVSVGASPRRVRAATSSSASGANSVPRVGSILARQLRGDGGLRVTVLASSRRARRRHQGCGNDGRNGNISSLAPRAFSPAAGDFSVTLPEGVVGLAAILGARVALIGREEERERERERVFFLFSQIPVFVFFCADD